MTALPRRAALALLAAPAVARAQARTLRLVLPFAPGGLTDILARACAEQLQARTGQPVVVENRAGAGGNLAAEAVARAAPDGTTLLVATQGIVAINTALYASLPYDPDRDFTPVAMLGQQPNLLVASPRALPGVADLASLLARLRAAPGTPYGSNGVGSFTHLSMELFRSLAGVEMTHVPYRGSAPLLTDMVAGTVPLAFDGLATSAPQVRPGGALRALAVSSAARFRALPEVPAVAEALPGFDASPWYGVFAHAASPEPVLAALEAAFRAVLEGPPWAAVLAQREADAMPQGRAALLPLVARERQVWREAVRRSGARAE